MNDLLRDELLEMAAADLAAFEDMENEVSASPELRTRADARSGPHSSSPAWPVEWTDDPPPSIKRLQTMVERNTGRMKEIIRDAGWPGLSTVGDEGAAAAWLLIHHTADLDLQRACITHLSTAVDHGEADVRHLEWLTDRVLLREGKPERYGTHSGRQGAPPGPHLPRTTPSSL